MPISDEALIQLAEQEEELRARCAVLYDALDHVRNMARNARAPGADAKDGLARIEDRARAAKRLCDSLNGAAHVRGMELLDEEIIELEQAAGGFRFLTPEGQIKYVAARKRATFKALKEAAAESKQSLRAHGTALLRLHVGADATADTSEMPDGAA